MDNQPNDDQSQFINKMIPIPICEIHTSKQWMEFEEYVDNHDGTVSCSKCPWGTRIPGWAYFHNGKIHDLRDPKSD